MIKDFFLGLFITGAGTLLVIYTEPILAFSGRIEVAEDWLRLFGGSRLMIKLMGIGAIIVGLLMATGQLDEVVLWLFGGLFQGFNPETASPAGS